MLVKGNLSEYLLLILFYELYEEDVLFDFLVMKGSSIFDV